MDNTSLCVNCIVLGIILWSSPPQNVLSVVELLKKYESLKLSFLLPSKITLCDVTKGTDT